MITAQRPMQRVPYIIQRLEDIRMKPVIAPPAASAHHVGRANPAAGPGQPVKAARDPDPKHAHQVHQRPLQEHVVLEKVELEHELRLGSLRGAVHVALGDRGHGGIVPMGEEGEFPPEATRDFGEAVEFGPGRRDAVQRGGEEVVALGLAGAIAGRGGRGGSCR